MVDPEVWEDTEGVKMMLVKVCTIPGRQLDNCSFNKCTVYFKTVEKRFSPQNHNKCVR